MEASSLEARPRSRRAVLAGALGGLSAWIASAAARVDPTAAAAGDPIRIGQLNTAGGTSTTLETSDSKPTFRAVQLGGGNALRGEAKAGRAVMGVAGPNGTGVYGFSPNHVGVRGQSDSGTGVIASSGTGKAVDAMSERGAAVSATSWYGRAVYGESGSGFAGLFVGKLGVDGHVDFDDWSTDEAGSPDLGHARLFASNSFGKTSLCVQFSNGAVHVLATQE